MPTIEPELQPPVVPTPLEAARNKAVGAFPRFAFTIIGCITGFFIATPIVVVVLGKFSFGIFVLPAVAVIIGLVLGGLYTHLARQRGMALIWVVSLLGVACSIALAWIITAVASYLH